MATIGLQEIDLAPNSWERRTILILTLVLTALPLCWPKIPPLLDLPSHMASYRIALDGNHSPALHRYFDYHWALIGNLGFDLLMMPLGRLLGVELATKLLAISVPVLTALGFLMVAREGHGRIPPTAFAAVPLAYNYPFMFGFVNYSLSAALAFIAFAVWLRMSAKEQVRLRTFAFLLIAAIIWITHAIGWVLLCAMCGASELHRRLASGEPPFRGFGRAVLACVPLLSPLVLLPFSPHTGFSVGGWLIPLQLAKWTLSLLRDRWIVLDLVSAAILVLLVVAALFQTSRLRMNPRLAWPAAGLLALYVLAPQSINGSDFVSARIVP